MSENHLRKGIIQYNDDNAGSERKDKTRLDKNKLTDCAAQFCPFECDILFQDAKCTGVSGADLWLLLLVFLFIFTEH